MYHIEIFIFKADCKKPTTAIFSSCRLTQLLPIGLSYYYAATNKIRMDLIHSHLCQRPKKGIEVVCIIRKHSDHFQPKYHLDHVLKMDTVKVKLSLFETILFTFIKQICFSTA